MVSVLRWPQLGQVSVEVRIGGFMPDIVPVIQSARLIES